METERGGGREEVTEEKTKRGVERRRDRERSRLTGGERGGGEAERRR